MAVGALYEVGIEKIGRSEDVSLEQLIEGLEL